MPREPTAPAQSAAAPLPEQVFSSGATVPLAAIGDTFEILVHSAPELNRIIEIGADGKITLPLSGPIPATGRPLEAIAADIEAALSAELLDPSVAIVPISSPAPAIYVGGAVSAPDRYVFEGPLTPLQALILAGGLKPSQTPLNLIILRRNGDGAVEQLTFPLPSGEPTEALATSPLLRRYDVVYVTSQNSQSADDVIEHLATSGLPKEFVTHYSTHSIYR